MSFDRQPTLTGDTLRLRPLRAEDRDPLYAAASDPLVWQQHPAHDRHERPVFDAFFDDALRSGGALTVLTADGRVIGTSRYHDPDERSVEIGWTFLARSHWGGSTNRELKRLMLTHAFATVDTVRFRVGEHNMRSQRAVEKLGARRTGDDDGAGNVLFELTHADWQRANR